MSTFVDTSAFLAVLDADDQNHLPARAAWNSLISDEDDLVCTNYVLVETFALIQNRLGLAATRTFHEDIVPLLRVEWIDTHKHDSGVTAVLSAGRRQLSLVDCVSFDVMRRLGVTAAFTFDRHFADQGFRCTP